MEKLRTVLRIALVAWWMIPFMFVLVWLMEGPKQAKEACRDIWRGRV